MINKILFVVTFTTIGAMAYNEYHSHRKFEEDISRFINIGARFTAQDGTKLCNRVRKIEEKLYMEADYCEYGTTK